MRKILISEKDYFNLKGFSCVTHDQLLYNKLHKENVKPGENLRCLVKGKDLYCDILIVDVEDKDRTIWIEHLGNNE